MAARLDGRAVRGRVHRAGQEGAGAVPRQGANVFGGVRCIRHAAHFAGVDLCGLGHRAAGRGDRRLRAQPGDARGAPA